MKMKFTLLLWLAAGLTMSLNAQSLMELKEKKAALEAQAAEAQAAVDALNGEIAGVQGEIDIMGGWQKGLLANVGMNFGSQSAWQQGANPNSSFSSLGIGVNAYANSIREKDFWRNKGIISLGWTSLDTDTGDDVKEGLFSQRTTDIVNISSLYGKRLSDKWALSGLGELNTTIGNFFDPGTLDIGAGATWTPSNDLVVVFHPLNYHVAFASGTFGTEGGLGAKIRADYNHVFPNGLGVGSTLTTFVPYVTKTPTLSEWTWINNLTYSLKGGIGLNLAFGLRNADRDFADGQETKLQRYYNFGVSYTL